MGQFLVYLFYFFLLPTLTVTQLFVSLFVNQVEHFPKLLLSLFCLLAILTGTLWPS